MRGGRERGIWGEKDREREGERDEMKGGGRMME